MKKCLFTLAVCFLAGFVVAQQPTVDEIRNSGRYLYGIGEGSSHRKADNNALDHLITQITVQVKSYFVNKTTEEDGEIEEFAESVVETFSSVNLISAESLLLEERRGNFKVMRYILHDDLNLLFENRKRKITEYVKSALVAEKDLRIGDALKNYYWALALLKTHKDRDEIEFDFPQEGKRLLLMTLPDKINNIFSDLSFKVKKVENIPAEQYRAFHLSIMFIMSSSVTGTFLGAERM